jgi:hypothetical protein
MNLLSKEGVFASLLKTQRRSALPLGLSKNDSPTLLERTAMQLGANRTFRLFVHFRQKCAEVGLIFIVFCL